MVSKRIDRKQLLKEPDEFFTTTGRLINWAKAHPRQLTYAVCVLLLVVVAVSGYRYFTERRAQTASNLLSQTLINYQQALAAGDAKQALSTVEPDFKRLISEYGGQPAGRLGLVYHAHFSAAAQESDTAIELYQKALNRFKGDPALTTVIIQGLATAYEQKGDAAAAIEQYRKIAQSANSLHKADALFQLGRLYRQAGEADKSREVLQQLGNEFPDSIYSQPAAEIAAS
jgi:tetratricopeptide (TPR) repeat protein